MGKVIIFPETAKNPITLIGHRAGICYESDVSDPEKNYKRGLDCIKSGHGRALEFVDVHLGFKGYSAKVIREWYTHIGGAPTRLQASTRYIEYGNFKYIIPDSIKNNPDALWLYEDCMNSIRATIASLEENYKIPREDASMLCPLGMETMMVDKRNVRNLIDMSRNRECNRAFWEYRQLFSDVKNALAHWSKEWQELIDLTFHPKCVELRYCPEDKGCGRYPKKEDLYTIGMDLANERK